VIASGRRHPSERLGAIFQTRMITGPVVGFPDMEQSGYGVFFFRHRLIVFDPCTP